VVATFCLRLAAGLILMLPFLPMAHIPPRFFRVHFLTALGLLTVAGIFVFEIASIGFWLVFALAVLGCLVGSIVWHLDEAPGGTVAIFATPVALVACLIYGGVVQRPTGHAVERAGDDVLSALVLGSSTTAMLMGHSYLISPAMTIAPLMRLLGALGIAVLLRTGAACFGLWHWSSMQSLSGIESELMLLLPVRWVLGLIAPLVLGWMAFEAARIRSTQSATGILYVVVIVSFVGELMSMLVIEKTGFVL
jgi:hypothetical protein